MNSKGLVDYILAYDMLVLDEFCKNIPHCVNVQNDL